MKTLAIALSLLLVTIAGQAHAVTFDNGCVDALQSKDFTRSFKRLNERAAALVNQVQAFLDLKSNQVLAQDSDFAFNSSQNILSISLVASHLLHVSYIKSLSVPRLDSVKDIADVDNENLKAIFLFWRNQLGVLDTYLLAIINAGLRDSVKDARIAAWDLLMVASRCER